MYPTIMPQRLLRIQEHLQCYQFQTEDQIPHLYLSLSSVRFLKSMCTLDILMLILSHSITLGRCQRLFCGTFLGGQFFAPKVWLNLVCPPPFAEKNRQTVFDRIPFLAHKRRQLSNNDDFIYHTRNSCLALQLGSIFQTSCHTPRWCATLVHSSYWSIKWYDGMIVHCLGDRNTYANCNTLVWSSTLVILPNLLLLTTLILMTTAEELSQAE